MASERVSSGGFVGNRTEIAFLFHRATASPLSWPVVWEAEGGAAETVPIGAVTAASPRLANAIVRADALRFLIIFIVQSFVLLLFVLFVFVGYGERRR
jgi:hypothetical protein